MANDVFSKVSNSAFDYAIFGGTDNSGKVNQSWGLDALTNSVLMWLGAFQGEIIRDPLKGGYLIKLLTKPMNQVRIDDFKRTVLKGLKDEFQPALSDISLDIVPDYTKKNYLITLTAWCPTLQGSISVSQKVKNIA